MDTNKISTDDLIDCLPQNRPLYKDSGLWQIRTDDMENIYMQQNCNETLRGFIIRYLEWLKEHEDITEVRIDLSLRQDDFDDDDNEFQRCSKCDGHDACEDFGCAFKAGLGHLVEDDDLPF